MRDGRGDEEGREGCSERPVSPGCERDAADRRADEVPGLERCRPHAGHAQAQLWSESEPARASRERSASCDEAEDGEER